MSIISLCYQPAPSEFAEPYQFNRVPVDQVNLIAGHGIEGDRKAGRNPKRQINILSTHTTDLLRDLGFKTGAGELGEQLVIDDVDVMTLPIGTQLQLGDTAVIELTMVRTGCEWLEAIHGQSKDEAVDRLGMLAKVIESGTIRVGDVVRVLTAEAIPATNR